MIKPQKYQVKSLINEFKRGFALRDLREWFFTIDNKVIMTSNRN